jgi:hypothetical protein
MHMSELREKVARMIAAHVGEEKFWGLYRDTADAAIALVRAETLEEAAKLAARYPNITKSTIPVHAASPAGAEIAAAILALVKP